MDGDDDLEPLDDKPFVDEKPIDYENCRVCGGEGELKSPDWGSNSHIQYVTCHACKGKGWIR